MELLVYKDETTELTYYFDNRGNKVYHGEYKSYCNGQIWNHGFYYHFEKHGEYKLWVFNGELSMHCFYINGKRHPYIEMNEQEKLLFQIKHPGFRFLEE